LEDLRLQHLQMSAERSNTAPCDLGQPLITSICDDSEQLIDTVTPDRRDDAKLSKMSADRIDNRSLLTDEEMTRPMQHQAALLLRCLGLNEPHVRPAHGLADCLCVGSIVLLSLDVRLHVGWRHEPHTVAERLKFTRPVMRRGAGLDAN